MGTNTLVTRSTGQVILEAFFNDYKEALGGTLVPRNASGIPTDILNDLGSTTHRWKDLFANRAFLGAVASLINFEEDTGDLILKLAGTEINRWSTAGLDGAGLENFTVSQLKQTGMDEVISASSGAYGMSSSTFATPTNLSVTLVKKTSTRPVFIGLVGEETGGSPSYLSTSIGSTIFVPAEYRFRRASSQISLGQFDAAQLVDSNTEIIILPPSAFWHLDRGQSAGSITYDFQVRTTISASVQVLRVKLFAVEL